MRIDIYMSGSPCGCMVGFKPSLTGDSLELECKQCRATVSVPYKKVPVYVYCPAPEPNGQTP